MELTTFRPQIFAKTLITELGTSASAFIKSFLRILKLSGLINTTSTLEIARWITVA